MKQTITDKNAKKDNNELLAIALISNCDKLNSIQITSPIVIGNGMFEFTIVGSISEKDLTKIRIK